MDITKLPSNINRIRFPDGADTWYAIAYMTSYGIGFCYGSEYNSHKGETYMTGRFAEYGELVEEEAEYSSGDGNWYKFYIEGNEVK